MTACPRTILLAAALALPAGHAAAAQPDFPARSLRMVNPYTPGGSVDLIARAVASGVSEVWNEQVIVDNRAGASTMIGTEIVVRAEPDGHTVLCTSSTIAILPALYEKMRFDPGRDLRAIVLVANSPSLLVTHPGFAPRSVKDLIALARAQPGKITAASSGVGSTTHLTMELFRYDAKIDLVHVPYKGGAPSITDLIGGQVNLLFNTPGTLLPHVRNNRLRALAITSAQRAEYAPDIPTVSESGLPGFETYIWYGVYGPRTLPDRLVQAWNEATNRYLRTPQAQEYFQRAYMKPIGGTPASFADYHKAEIARWRAVVKAAKIPPQ